MLDFAVPKIEDKKWFDEIIKPLKPINIDNSFATVFLWRRRYKTKICRFKDFILKQMISDSGDIVYSFPAGRGNIMEALSEIITDNKKRTDKPLNLYMPKNHRELLDELLPDSFDYKAIDSDSEYIYFSENLATLAGRKFHSKRNHINKIKNLYDYSYEEISSRNFDDVIFITKKWSDANGCSDESSPCLAEHCAMNDAIKYFEELQLKGGLIRLSGMPAAMSIGSEISAAAFDVNFEKSIPGYDGLYALINNSFAGELTNYTYLNREEDMGIEGLRKAKLSYKPDIMFEKLMAVQKI